MDHNSAIHAENINSPAIAKTCAQTFWAKVGASSPHCAAGTQARFPVFRR
jgi:hypothetical protein